MSGVSPYRKLVESMHPAPPYLSVVIPAFNEAGSIGDTLQQMARHLAHCHFSSEILVIDDGSADGTGEVALSSEVGSVPVEVLRHEKNSGKGYAVQRGALRARGDVILICDADLPVSLDHLAPMLHRLREGSDLVIASRALPDSLATLSQPPHRALLGKLFNRLVRWWLLPNISDTQCGFKLISRRAAEMIFPRQRIAGFAFDVEVLFLAKQSGFAIAEVPVTWRHVNPSRVSPLKDGLQMLIDLLRIRCLWWQGRYARGRKLP